MNRTWYTPYMRRGAALAACGLLALTAACSSSGSAKSAGPSSGGSSATGSSSAASALPSTCQGTAASGTPILFGQVVSLSGSPAFPGTKAGAQAAASCINAGGGIGGRPIKIDTCDDANDPATARKCAQTFVSEKVVAVVGNLSVVAEDELLPVLAQAGIPNIGAVPLAASDFSNPFSFPISGGSPGIFNAEAKYLVETVKIKKLGLVYSNYAPAKQAADGMAAFIKTLDSSIQTREIPLDLSAVDVTPSVTALTAGFAPDAVTNMYAGSQCAAGFRAYQAAGLTAKIPIFYTSSCNTSDAIKAAGSAADGLYFNSINPDPSVPGNASKPEVKDYLAIMNKYQPGKATGDSPTSYSGVFFIKNLLGSTAATDITSSKIVSSLKSAKAVPIPLETPYTWDPTQPAQKAIPTLANPSVAFVQYKAGAYIQTTGWINGF